MARASQQYQSAEDEHDPGEWQSLRTELVALLDQVDGRMAQHRSGASFTDRVRDMRNVVAESGADTRHRDALRQVQRAITRFEDGGAMPQMPPNPRDSLQAAIDQIRTRQATPRAAMAQPQPAAPVPVPRAIEPGHIERLAQSVNGLSGRLERLESEIKAQVTSGANVKDVADQVSQLAHVVELLAGAVGETGQVKRLEGQIASLGKIISQGREMDISSLTRRLDDVAGTVGRLAELQVHFADRVENPVATQAFKESMHTIEVGVRNVYDRIDTLERQARMSPADLEYVTAEMARFTESMRSSESAPQNLVELIDALNTRITEIEGGDRLLHALRRDLSALREAVVVSLAPRFDAIEQRMDALSTREDMAEIGRQIGELGDRIGDRPIDPGIGQLEAQVRQLVARMDQTGEQLSGLAKLYSSEPASGATDFDTIAEVVAARTAEVMSQQRTDDAPLAETISGLETRIVSMLASMRRDPETDDFGGMQAGISEVNERLQRLETSLLSRFAEPSPTPLASAMLPPEATTPAPAVEPRPMPSMRRDDMPRSPSDDAPLVDHAFAPPTAVQEALDSKTSRRRHPGMEEDSLASRYEVKPVAPVRPADVEAGRIALPAAPQPSFGFGELSPVPQETSAVSASSRNTFIEAARRAAQRQQPTAPMAQPNSLMGRALSRFQATTPEAKSKASPSRSTKPAARAEMESMSPIEPTVAAEAPASLEPGPESFLSRNRKTILLAAAVVALGFLTINLAAQRLLAPNEDSARALATDVGPATMAPATTGDIAPIVPSASDVNASPSLPPRVIPMVDSLKTGSIDPGAAQGFAAVPATQDMPSAFEATTQLASVDAPTDTPAAALPATNVSPIKVDMPPDGVGPIELRQAAADGDARAQFEVAAIFTEGRAVPQDYKAAATWFERAAAQGFAPAQYRLGSLYENGNGIGKDLNTARLWYERAAEAGNRMSMHNLAALYAGGALGKQQFDSAAKWFEEAADRGLVDSQFNLGMLYARGLGVPQSLETSFKWFGIAALSGDKDAAKARDDIARSLDAATLSRVQSEVTAFRPKSINLAANFAPIGTWMKAFDPGETITTKDIVLSVQKALVKLGYDIGTPDGIAGKKTADAIKAFESGTGMSQLGLINPRLLAVLGSQPV